MASSSSEVSSQVPEKVTPEIVTERKVEPLSGPNEFFVLEEEQGYQNLTEFYRYLVRECLRYLSEAEIYEKGLLENPEGWDVFCPGLSPPSEDGITNIVWPFFDEKDKHFALILAVLTCVMKNWRDEVTRLFIVSFFFFATSKLCIQKMSVENVRTYMQLADTFEENFPGVSENYDVALQVFSSFGF